MKALRKINYLNCYAYCLRYSIKDCTYAYFERMGLFIYIFIQEQHSIDLTQLFFRIIITIPLYILNLYFILSVWRVDLAIVVFSFKMRI